MTVPDVDDSVKREQQMNIRQWLVNAAVGALALGAQAANATTICAGCESIDGAAGTNIGAYNPDTMDEGTFNHTGIQNDVGASTAFEDFFVFDLNPGGSGSISADFTTTTRILDFVGELYADNGSVCDAGAPSSCSSVSLGSLIGSASAVGDRWEIIADGLPAGRYIIRITGSTRASGSSTYSGQLAFVPEFVPEPGTLALLGLGLLGIGIAPRRRSAS
jgi:hypothetical protein